MNIWQVDVEHVNNYNDRLLTPKARQTKRMNQAIKSKEELKDNRMKNLLRKHGRNLNIREKLHNVII
jgi:hypothetical protein